MLEQRVARVEVDMTRVLSILERLEPRIIELHAKMATQSELLALKADVLHMDEGVDGVDMRFAAIPTTWQIISILAVLLLGIAGIIFTAGRYFHP